MVLLAEAFTRPAMMRALAKVGFHQSYTYYTWRNGKAEIEDYFTELAARDRGRTCGRASGRHAGHPHAYMQSGGRAAFALRAVLAATGSPTWGVYTGFELVENVAAPGAEEYIDSEKYQLRPRDFAAASTAGRAWSRSSPG